MNIIPTNKDGVLTYKAWVICRRDGAAAEVTMDEAKANVWRRGGHIVVELTGARAAPDDKQMDMLRAPQL
jgi:invasion protein IalB